MEATLHNTPLVQEHVALGAKMVGFGGWNMPLQYESILAEWEYNRKTASLFDCSHMGEFMIKGRCKGLRPGPHRDPNHHGHAGQYLPLRRHA